MSTAFHNVIAKFLGQKCLNGRSVDVEPQLSLNFQNYKTDMHKSIK